MEFNEQFPWSNSCRIQGLQQPQPFVSPAVQHYALEGRTGHVLALGMSGTVEPHCRDTWRHAVAMDERKAFTARVRHVRHLVTMGTRDEAHTRVASYQP